MRRMRHDTGTLPLLYSSTRRKVHTYLFVTSKSFNNMLVHASILFF